MHTLNREKKESFSLQQQRIVQTQLLNPVTTGNLRQCAQRVLKPGYTVIALFTTTAGDSLTAHEYNPENSGVGVTTTNMFSTAAPDVYTKVPEG